MSKQLDKKDTFDTMRRYIRARTTYLIVKTPLGAVKVTKKEALRLLDGLEESGRVPTFDCQEVAPHTMKYLTIISDGEPGIYIS